MNQFMSEDISKKYYEEFLRNWQFPEQSSETGKITEALSKAQGEYEPPIKNKTVEFGDRKYVYAEFSSYIKQLKIPLKENGLCYTQKFRPSYHQHIVDGLVIMKASEIIITTLSHISGEWFKSYTDIRCDLIEPFVIDKWGKKKSVNVDQEKGSKQTYNKRYSLSAITGLDAEIDTDGVSIATIAREFAEEKVEERAMEIVKEKALKKIEQEKRPRVYEKQISKTIDPNTMLVKTITKLCVENDLDIAEFTKFHNITRAKPETVKSAVDNFESLKDQFIKNESDKDSK